MRKKLFFITTFVSIFLANLFWAPVAKADPSAYRWISPSKIYSNEGGDFNLATTALDISTIREDDYYIFVGVRQCTYGNYPAVCYIAASKEDPISGLLIVGGVPKTITLGNIGAAPEPVQKITQGAIWGQIYQEGDWKGTKWNWMEGKNIQLIHDSGLEIQNLKVHTSAEDFPTFDKHTINLHDPNYLWPGRYRLKFYEHQKADCSTGDITGDVGDSLQNLLCTVTIQGIFNFDLVATGNGGGKVVPVGNQQKEMDSLGEGISTADLDKEPKIQMGMEYKFSTPLSDAIQSAIKSVLEWVQTVMDWGKEGIQKILVEGNDLENQPGVQAVWKATRNITLSLLTLGILLIAFANILQINIQAYGLGRMLPRMIIGIVLTYFSFLISAFLLDMMSAFQSLLLNNTGTNNAIGNLSQQFSSSSSLAVQGSAVGELIFLCLIGIALALVVIWLYVILIVRIAMLYIIVGIAPIAFMAYIMPFTERYYKDWWAAFWKWAFMGPAVAFMLWLSQKFLTEGYFGTKQAQTGGTIETWVWLIGAGVLLWLAATLPLKMGKEVYSAIQSGLKKAGSTAGKMPGIKTVKDTYGQFKTQRQQYSQLMAKKRATDIRNQVGRMGALGGIVAGRRGLTENKQIATQMHKADMKDMTAAQLETRLSALTAKGTRSLDYNNPEAIALMETIASTQHTAAMSDNAKRALAQGFSASLTGAAHLKGLQGAVFNGPDKNAMTSLYADYAKKAKDPTKAYRLGGNLEDFEKKVIGNIKTRTTIDRMGNDISAYDHISKFGTSMETQLDAGKIEAADQAFFTDPNNKAQYTAKATTSNQEAHERAGLHF